MNTCTLLDIDQVISISANGDAFGIFLNPDKLVNEYNTIEQMFGIGRVNRGNLCNIKNCTKLKKKVNKIEKNCHICCGVAFRTNFYGFLTFAMLWEVMDHFCYWNERNMSINV